MIPVRITDHVDAALDRKVEHFSGNKPVLNGIAFSHIDQYQQLENATWDVVYGRLLDPAPGQSVGARGAQLDVLGKLVGCKRQGYTDDQYVLAIKLQVLINKSFGTTEDLLHIVRTAIGVSGVITARHEEYYHVAYYRLDNIAPNLAVVLYRSLQKARAAGYRAILEYYTTSSPGGASNMLKLAWTNSSGTALSGTGANTMGWTDSNGNLLPGDAAGFVTAYQG